MTNEEAAMAVVDALESLEIPSMIVGSLATNFYGIPRMTLDADFVLEMAASAIRAVVDRLGARTALPGPPFPQKPLAFAASAPSSRGLRQAKRNRPERFISSSTRR